ncbi:MAG: response regulator [Leptospiraceae bacterium]|nr:response regulator [Leptospiraceae bacterium]MCP5495693.1 response regulator [Leptospiraceae bacterium]
MEPTTQSKILIVDDLPENIFVLERILRKVNVNIFKAQSGMEALSLILYHEFALILLDVQMPEMDGFETANFIRQNESSKNVPIIFVTAISKEPENISKGFELGAFDYLFKPVEPEIIKTKVRFFIELYEERQNFLHKSKGLLLQLANCETELKKQKAYIDLVVDSIEYIPNSIAYIKSNGGFLHCNTNFSQLIGYSKQEVATLSIEDLITPNDLIKYRSITNNLCKGDAQSAAIQLNLISKDQTILEINANINLIDTLYSLVI